MPRQPRKPSGTGIFHVMMRGINHQNIFEDKEDYYRFLSTLEAMAESYEEDGTPAGRNYTLYAYCLMSNHFHLLIRERDDDLAMAVKRIASSYVYYYNHKYGRDGHLFREAVLSMIKCGKSSSNSQASPMPLPSSSCPKKSKEMP